MKQYDTAIIGAGAAGLAAAAQLIQRGRRVIIFDMGTAPARKVMASGGGRCNITNAAVGVDRYYGENPNFVRGALARVTPANILTWMQEHNLGVVEKAAGQYFCATGAADVVRALISDIAGATLKLQTRVHDIEHNGNEFIIHTDNADYGAESVILATGGVSFAALGVSDFGCQIAKKFGHKIIPMRPALCAIGTNAFDPTLAGISMMCQIMSGRRMVTDSVLFTHFGIGGPAAYRATLWGLDNDMHVNLMPGIDVRQWLRIQKRENGRKNTTTILAARMPARVAKWIAGTDTRNIADYKDSELDTIAARISDIVLHAADMRYHNMQSAEVVRGGISTDQISSKTMESKLVSGLFFAGELIDIAGDLGGFNLHWAWASGNVAGQNA